MVRGLIFAMAVATLTPTAGQAALRSIKIKSDAAWRHEGSGLSLPATLAAMKRKRIDDTGAAELDILANYEIAGGSLLATVYIFRPQIADPALWFDRAVTGMLTRPDYALPPASQDEVRSMASNGGPGGLRAFATTKASDYGAVGVGVTRAGDWIVKIRLSSVRADLPAMDALFDRVVDELKLPASAAVTPVAPCSTPLRFEKTVRERPMAMEQALIGALLSVPTIKGDASKRIYCRDANVVPRAALYRADDSTDGYVIAFEDAGRSVNVKASTPAENGDRRYGVTFQDLDRSLVFADLDGLAAPQRVIEHVSDTTPVAISRIDGKTAKTEINASRITESKPPQDR